MTELAGPDDGAVDAASEVFTMQPPESFDAYPTSLDHIVAELERLDLLIRLQVWRSRQRARQDDGLQTVYIAEDEPEELLDRIVGTPGWAVTALPPDLLDAAQQRLDVLAEMIGTRTAASVGAGVPLRLLVLGELFGLSRFDLDVVLLCLAPELDRRYGRLYGYLHDDVTRQCPSCELVVDLLCPDLRSRVDARQRFGAAAPLRDRLLLQAGEALQLEGRVTRYLLDDDHLDDGLGEWAELVDPTHDLDALVLPAVVRDQLARHIGRSATLGEHTIAYLHGPYGVGKQAVADAWAAALGRRMLVVDGHALAARGTDEFRTELRRIDREALLQEALLHWQGFDALLADDRRSHLTTALRMLEHRRGHTVLAGEVAWEPSDALHDAPFVHVELTRPDYEERLTLWRRAIDGDGLDLDLAAAASMFRLTGGQIRDAAAAARSLARARRPGEAHITDADLLAACRTQSNPKLAELGQKLLPHFGWDDLVLPSRQRAQLHEVADQVRYRAVVYDAWGFGPRLVLGTGLNVLFVGPPGTGKTMAADVLAHTLGLDLYRIDLAAVVSKYIGETEKNLSRIFAEAATSNAILFFDEADALFGKRTQVHDAHDRYANIEVSYLLQRMEEYEGVVVLATNLRQNIDPAFVRRLDFVVEFPFPDAADRERIWSGIWPAATPRDDDVDPRELAARIEVAGGSIRNIAVASAFLAAADGGVVAMRHLVQATQREYQKIGKVLTGREFDALDG